MFLAFFSGKKYSESNLNNIAPLCHYRYSCGVDFTITIDLERLLKLYSSHQSYCPLCERALNTYLKKCFT